mgnify:FL=1
MPYCRGRIAAWMAAALLLVPLLAGAQQADRFGDYEIHYSAMPTGMLNAAVAEEYRIMRSRTRGMVMITVLRDGEPVEARIDILARDNDDEITEIGARRVRDDGWTSYVGTFGVTDGEALTFEITVKPYQGGGPYQIAFRQTFYTGE